MIIAFVTAVRHGRVYKPESYCRFLLCHKFIAAPTTIPTPTPMAGLPNDTPMPAPIAMPNGTHIPNLRDRRSSDCCLPALSFITFIRIDLSNSLLVSASSFRSRLRARPQAGWIVAQIMERRCFACPAQAKFKIDRGFRHDKKCLIDDLRTFMFVVKRPMAC